MVVVLDQISAGAVEIRDESRPKINRGGVFEPRGSFRVGAP